MRYSHWKYTSLALVLVLIPENSALPFNSNTVNTLTLPLLWGWLTDSRAYFSSCCNSAATELTLFFLAASTAMFVASLHAAAAQLLRKVMHSQWYFQRCARVLILVWKPTVFVLRPTYQANRNNCMHIRTFLGLLHLLSFCGIFHVGMRQKFHTITEDVPAAPISYGVVPKKCF